MAYSFSFDASLKLTTTSNLAGFLNHFAREENEIDMNHSNENIDPERTPQNRTYIYDAQKGCMVRSTSHEQIMDAMRASIDRAVDVETATYRNTGRAIRKDAVLAYGLIMQIDPQFYRDNKDDSMRMAQSYVDMIELAQKRFGKENIVAVSLHLDEVNPHLHFMMTPVTDDNRLSSKEFINKPKLKQMHGEFRKSLREKGYDIDLERRTPLGAKRLSEKDYKELQRQQENLQEIEEQQQQLLENEIQQNQQAYNLASVQMMLADREKALKEQEQRASAHLGQAVQKHKNAVELMNKAQDAWSLAEQAHAVPAPSDKASRMATFMQRYSMNGKDMYQMYQEAEPAMIQQEEKNAKLLAELNRKYGHIQRSFNDDLDFGL